MRRFVWRRFLFAPGFFGNRPVGSLMDSKMEDVINQSSNYNLKFWSIFILIQPNPRVPQWSKFQTSSVIFMTVRTQQVYFPTSFCFQVGPADKFLAVLCVCRGLFGNRLMASLQFCLLALSTFIEVDRWCLHVCRARDDGRPCPPPPPPLFKVQNFLMKLKF